MLEATINKARNLLGLGGLKNPPKNVYPKPYSPNSFGIFFDVRKELFNFVGEEVAGIIGGGMQTLLPGTQLSIPFKMPDVGATLSKLTKKFSLYSAEAKLIGMLKSKDDKKPFFDIDKHSQLWAGKSINKIYNANTSFKFPITTENTKYGGGFGVLALSFMSPKGTIYKGTNKPATMIDKYSKPLNKGHAIGILDYNQIQFPSSYHKYPVPVTKGSDTLWQIWAKAKGYI